MIYLLYFKKDFTNSGTPVSVLKQGIDLFFFLVGGIANDLDGRPY